MSKDDTPLTEEELIKLQFSMAATFRAIHALPLDRYIEETSHALTIGPILDPTLYIEKGDDAKRMLRIAQALRRCRDEIHDEFKDVKGKVEFQIERRKQGTPQGHRCIFCGNPMKPYDSQEPGWELPEHDHFERRTRFFCIGCGWEARFYKFKTEEKTNDQG